MVITSWTVIAPDDPCDRPCVSPTFNRWDAAERGGWTVFEHFYDVDERTGKISRAVTRARVVLGRVLNAFETDGTKVDFAD